MRAVVFTVVDEGTSNVMPPDNYISPFNLALSVVIDGTVTYTVQYTFDDVFAKGYDPTSGNWVNHPSLTAQTTTKDSNIAYPVTGVRIQTAEESDGTAVLTIIQAGGGGNA
jgi:hypothetical protein